MFCGEHFHHMDWLLMAAGWAHISGNILGMDNISRLWARSPYPCFRNSPALIGRFDYVNAVIVMMMISVVYYWIWFYALRLVLKDTAWAFIAIFFGLRLHFFNIETFPFIFTYPQVTPLRFFCDSLFFIFLILHMQAGRMIWLYLVSAVSGFAIFYITGEGMYTLTTFYIFCSARAFVIMDPGRLMRRLNKKQGLLCVSPGWYYSLGMAAGAHIFTGIFWSNQFDYVRFIKRKSVMFFDE